MLRSRGEEQMIHANLSAKASSNALEAGLRVTVRKGWRWQWQGILWPRAGGGRVPRAGKLYFLGGSGVQMTKVKAVEKARLI